MEATIAKTRFEQLQAALLEVCDGTLADNPTTEVTDQTDALEDSTTEVLRLPKDTTAEVRTKLQNENQRRIIMEVWPTIGQNSLDGKSPQEVQGDPKYRVRLLAAVLLLELHGQQSRWGFDYDQLRQRLEQPTTQRITPASGGWSELPLCRYWRIDAANLSSPELAELFQYSAMMQAQAAVRNLGEQLVERDDLGDEISVENVYGVLTRAARDSDESLDLLEKAKAAAVAAGQSPARWLLAQLSIQIEAGDGDKAQATMQQLQSKHSREPGVMQSLMNLLAQYGLIEPGGAPAGPSPAAVPAAAATSVEEGGVWTPSGAPAAVETAEQPAAEEKKSELWLPGMD